MPKVTVLTAVYNGESYLREAIDSILAQTFPDFEFLIINDGSTDSTQEIIQFYDDPRIRLINNEYNLGLTRSLNKGLELAKGEFIARQDADDISEPERLAKQVAFLETHPEVALVGTWYKDIDPQGNLIGECNLPCDCTQIRWDILFYCPFVHSAVMFRKHTIAEQIGFYDEAFSYAQDYDLWWRISRRLQVANINEYLMKLRINPSSMTATYGNIVDDEPLKIKITNIGHLLGWDEAKTWNDGVLLRAMTWLWLGELDKLNSLNLQQLNKVIEQILHLHHAFCKYYKLNHEEIKKHYNQVYACLSNQLLSLTYYYLEKDKMTAWWLFIRACRLNFSILLTKKYLSLFIKLLIGSRLVRDIRHLTREKLKLEQN
ncbi:MAG: glycosyltransferase [Calothrix sp. MO_167.B12]|nr:glycosyltransferase [Calothrix sp. MO_167.B12]